VPSEASWTIPVTEYAKEDAENNMEMRMESKLLKWGKD
jgi:hypothetical protein